MRLLVSVACLGCAAATIIAVSCSSSPKPSPQSTHSNPMFRFWEILKDGKSLYGLGTGCDEWRAEPNADDGGSGSPNAGTIQGILTARIPDAEGRIFGFSYSLTQGQDLLRMRIAGRGSWSPAPGVVIADPKKEGYAVIGSGTYCTVDVDVRASPDSSEVILVGDEPWFLSRDACLQVRKKPKAASPGCRDTGKSR